MSDAGDEISIADVIRAVVRYRWLVIGVTVVATALALAAAFLITPLYRADALLAPMNRDAPSGIAGLAGQLGGLTSLVGIDLGSEKGGTAEAIATLKSRAFTVQFIDEEGILPALFPEKWDAEKGVWAVRNVKDQPTFQDGFRLFDKIRSVQEDPATGFVQLSIEWHDPVLAANWTNRLIQRANSLLQERAIQEADKSLRFLKDELKKTDIVEVRQAIYELIESTVKEIMLANVRQEYAFKVIDPAVVVEEEDRVWPKRRLIVVVGAALGLSLAFAIAVLRYSFVRP